MGLDIKIMELKREDNINIPERTAASSLIYVNTLIRLFSHSARNALFVLARSWMMIISRKVRARVTNT